MKQIEHTLLRHAASALMCMAPLLGAAQTDQRLPLWELGVGVLGVSQQTYPGAAEQLNRGLVFPHLVYRGQFLRADRDGVGLRAVQTPRFELDVGVAGSFGSSSNDIDARRGMPRLGTLVEFGPRLKWHLGLSGPQGPWRAEFAVRGVFNLSDGADYRGVSFEPKLVYANRAGPWHYSASAGALFADRRLADTYYGVAPAYATPARPAYAAGSGLVAWRLGVGASRELSPNWRVFGAARVESVAGAANRASPLVRRTHGASVGAGVIYTWARSDKLVGH